jgi:hypothetical protein
MINCTRRRLDAVSIATLRVAAIALVNPLPSSSLGDEKACLFARPPISGARSRMLIGGLGLREAACLWQAVPQEVHPD